MNILFPIGDWVYARNTNPYVRVLIDGLRRKHHIIDVGVDKFFHCAWDYDLIFFQWPDVFTSYAESEGIDLIKELQIIFCKLKQLRIKTIVTCHNLHPHNNDPLINEVYSLIYSNVDVIHHMGDYSYKLFMIKYPSAKHFIAPHPIYYDLSGFDKRVARKSLKIPIDDIVVLAFGSFRNEKEVTLFLEMAKSVGTKQITYLAPQIPYGSFYNGRMINRTFEFIFRMLKYKKLHIHPSGYVDELLIPTYFAAADVVFIQRVDILNTGNVPLAFSAGKVVAGPSLGNVGPILQETGNFVFDPKDNHSVFESVKTAIAAYKRNNQLGRDNYIYAKKNWAPQKVVNIIHAVINNL